MGPGFRLLSIYAGDDYDHVVTVVDGNDVPVDLSDRTWAAQWRKDEVSPNAVAFVVDSTNAAAGVLVVSMARSLTATLPRTGVWDLQGTYVVDGLVKTLLAGPVEARRDVTR